MTHYFKNKKILQTLKRKTIFLIQVILFVFTFSIIISCTWNKSVDEGYYFQDFDNLWLWDHSALVSYEYAHSGMFCTYADSIHPFSQAFEMDLASALSKHYKSVQVTAWCMKTNINSTAKLMVAVESQGKEIISQSVEFSKALEVPLTWINLVLILKFPKQFPDDSKIKIYCWSTEKEKSYMDDVLIEFRKK